MRNEVGVFPVSEEPGVQIVRRKFEFRFLTFLQGIYENAPFQTNSILLRDGGDRLKGARLWRGHLVNTLIRRDCPPKHRSDDYHDDGEKASATPKAVSSLGTKLSCSHSVLENFF